MLRRCVTIAHLLVLQIRKVVVVFVWTRTIITTLQISSINLRALKIPCVIIFKRIHTPTIETLLDSNM